MPETGGETALRKTENKHPNKLDVSIQGRSIHKGQTCR